MAEHIALLGDSIFDNAAYTQGLPVVDLRLICIELSDYANPLEPSSQGAAKIAKAIAAALGFATEAPATSMVVVG